MVHRVGSAAGIGGVLLVSVHASGILDILHPNKHDEGINLTWTNIHVVFCNHQPLCCLMEEVISHQILP